MINYLNKGNGKVILADVVELMMLGFEVLHLSISCVSGCLVCAGACVVLGFNGFKFDQFLSTEQFSVARISNRN